MLKIIMSIDILDISIKKSRIGMSRLWASHHRKKHGLEANRIGNYSILRNPRRVSIPKRGRVKAQYSE